MRTCWIWMAKEHTAHYDTPIAVPRNKYSFEALGRARSAVGWTAIYALKKSTYELIPTVRPGPNHEA